MISNLDYSIFLALNNLAARSPWEDRTIIFFAEYVAYILLLVLVVWILRSAYTKKEKIIIFVSAMIAGGIGRFVFAGIIRFFFHRLRPLNINNPVIHGLIKETSYSFPSGHASFFFAVSLIVYYYNKTLGIWFFVASIVMCAGRVAAGVHYPSDILGGIVVGLLAALITHKFLTPLFEKRFRNVV